MREVKKITKGKYTLTHSWYLDDFGCKRNSFGLFNEETRTNYPFYGMIRLSKGTALSGDDDVSPYTDQEYQEMLNNEMAKIESTSQSSNQREDAVDQELNRIWEEAVYNRRTKKSSLKYELYSKYLKQLIESERLKAKEDERERCSILIKDSLKLIRQYPPMSEVMYIKWIEDIADSLTKDSEK